MNYFSVSRLELSLSSFEAAHAMCNCSLELVLMWTAFCVALLSGVDLLTRRRSRLSCAAKLTFLVRIPAQPNQTFHSSVVGKLVADLTTKEKILALYRLAPQHSVDQARIQTACTISSRRKMRGTVRKRIDCRQPLSLSSFYSSVANTYS